jgi:hypothetical protein
MSFLDTLIADGEKLVEGELPSVNDVRSVVGGLLKRLENVFPQLCEDSALPAPAPVAPVLPTPVVGTPVVVPPSAPAATAAAPIVLEAPGAEEPAKTPQELQAEIQQLQAQYAASVANKQAPVVSTDLSASA